MRRALCAVNGFRAGKVYWHPRGLRSGAGKPRKPTFDLDQLMSASHNGTSYGWVQQCFSFVKIDGTNGSLFAEIAGMKSGAQELTRPFDLRNSAATQLESVF